MHPSSRVNMQKAIDSIKNTFPNDMLILDVGGRNVGGETQEHDRSYKYMFRSYKEYYVADINKGPNVTHLMKGDYDLPFEDNSIDLVVCGQTLEHVKNPFKSVAEMKRVVKMNHYICLCAPSAGNYHDNPDCWRFMDDAFKAIAEDIGGLKIRMDWIYRTGNDIDRGKRWMDHTCVMQKVA
mgnify:FL=1